jgi:hypothetical protein
VSNCPFLSANIRLARAKTARVRRRERAKVIKGMKVA